MLLQFKASNNYGQNIWDKLQFPCEIRHYGKSSVSIFQNFFASIEKDYFVRKTEHEAIIPGIVKIFLIFPNFLIS